MNKIDLDKVTNHEVKIYVETANKIMQECLSKAKARGNENAFTELSDMICERFTGITPDAKFLRNLHDKIKKLIDPAIPELEMVIYARNILALAAIADIGDYEVLKKKHYHSLFIPVMYAPKSWSFFTFIRVPKSGVLKQSHFNWEYNDGDGSKITGTVIAVDEFTMPGDRQPLWVRIKYIDNGKLSAAYFAEYLNQSIIPVSPTSRVLTLLQKLMYISDKKSIAF